MQYVAVCHVRNAAPCTVHTFSSNKVLRICVYFFLLVCFYSKGCYKKTHSGSVVAHAFSLRLGRQRPCNPNTGLLRQEDCEFRTNHRLCSVILSQQTTNYPLGVRNEALSMVVQTLNQLYFYFSTKYLYMKGVYFYVRRFTTDIGSFAKVLHWQEPLTDSQMRGSFPFLFPQFPCVFILSY